MEVGTSSFHTSTSFTSYAVLCCVAQDKLLGVLFGESVMELGAHSISTEMSVMSCHVISCCAVLCCGVQDKLLGLLFDESVMELALLVAGQVDDRRFKEDAPLLLDLLAAVYDVSGRAPGLV